MEDAKGIHLTKTTFLLIIVFTILATYALSNFYYSNDFPNTLEKAQSPKAATNQEAYTDRAKIEELKSRFSDYVAGPRDYTPIWERTASIAALIEDERYQEADDALQAIREQSEIKYWGYSPFAVFVSGLSDSQLNNENYLNHLNAWIKANHSSIPRLLRAIHYFNLAWISRGEDFRSRTRDDQYRNFLDHFETAMEDINKVIEMDPTLPLGAYWKLKILGSKGNSPEMDQAFEHAIQSFPDYYPLYSIRLNTLQPKWGGSIEQMINFVDYHAGGKPTSPHFKALYLELFADLVASMSTRCRSFSEEQKPLCLQAEMMRVLSVELNENIRHALELYHHIDKIAYSEKLKSFFYDLTSCKCGNRFSLLYFDMAAEIVGNENQLSIKDTSGNNYALDHAIGVYWNRNNHPDNAEKFYIRALKDIKHTTFPTAEDRDQALGRIFDSLSSLANTQKDYPAVIAYQDMAEHLGGPYRAGFSHLKCGAYDQLGWLNQAKTCYDTQINHGPDIDNYFWRGLTNKKMHHYQDAISDLTKVADVSSDYSQSAVIHMSVIYGDLNQFKEEVDLLNKYDYIFDEKVSIPSSIAIAYNNRCYGKMQLKAYKEALADCNDSIRYGDIPDAFAKQRKLLEILGESK